MSAGDWRVRVEQERAELFEKMQRLKSFIGSAAFSALDTVQQKMLHRQLGAMSRYHEILYLRLQA